VGRPPLLVAPDSTVAEASRTMRAAAASAALVATDPPAMVTDRDLRDRVLAEGLSAETPVRSVMSRPLHTLDEDAPLSRALLLMLDEGVEHVPVSRGGRIIGILTGADLLRQQARSPMMLLSGIGPDAGLDALDGYSDRIAATADALFTAEVSPTRIARVISSLNDALTEQLLRLGEAALGPPPCPYAWLVLGSEGRMEQALLSDQDNAVAYADDDAGERSYFQALAEHVVAGLLRAGFPECPGGYMATNWCRPLAEWREIFRTWVTEPTPQALVESEVFLDFRLVGGELPTGDLDQILLSGGGRGLFLFHLAKVARQFRPPLGRLGRIRSHDGAVDLKLGGLTAIVLLGRLYALAASSTARSTLDRLHVAAQAGVVSRLGAEALADTYRFLTRLRLGAQLRQLREGRAPDNTVQLDDLSALERRRLRDAFRTILELQEATTLNFGPRV
jgi:CBS domain-containing protein